MHNFSHLRGSADHATSDRNAALTPETAALSNSTDIVGHMTCHDLHDVGQDVIGTP